MPRAATSVGARSEIPGTGSKSFSARGKEAYHAYQRLLARAVTSLVRETRVFARVAKPSARELKTQAPRESGNLFADSARGGTDVNWFNLSFVGWLIVIVALALIAWKYDVAPFWIGVGALLLVGVGIITSVKHSKPRI